MERILRNVINLLLFLVYYKLKLIIIKCSYVSGIKNSLESSNNDQEIDQRII